MAVAVKTWDLFERLPDAEAGS